MYRIFEILLAYSLIMIFSPLLFIIAVMIVLETGFLVLYRSPRMGQYGKPFHLYNFRTQITNGDNQPATRVGQFVRNLSLDHLPQFFNILFGHMHIIGPRPMRPEQVDLNHTQYQKILAVKPGLFSPAILQLAVNYNASQFDTKVNLEKVYLDERSLVKDMKVIKNTFIALIQSRGNIKLRGKPSIVEEDLPTTEKDL